VVPEAHRRWSARALGVLLLVAATITLLTLWSYPPVFVDEAYRVSRAEGLLEMGWPFGDLDRGVFDSFDGHRYFFPWLDILPVSFLYRLFGDRLLSVRLCSMLFSVLLLCDVYLIAYRLLGLNSAIISTVVLFVSCGFSLSSRLGRQDVIVAALGYGSIALCVRTLQSRRPLVGFLSGLLVAMAFEVHPNGMIFGPIAVALYLTDGLTVLRAPYFWMAMLGIAGGLCLYAIVHILPAPDTYFSLVRMGYSSTHTPPFMSGQPASWIRGIGEALRLAWWNHSYYYLLSVWAVVVLVRRAKAGGHRVLAISVASLLSVGLCIGEKHAYYAVLLAPALSILLSMGLSDLVEAIADHEQRVVRRVLSAGALLAVLVVSFAPPVFRSASDIRHAIRSVGNVREEYAHVVARVGRHVPNTAVVIGPATYGLDLACGKYMTWEQIVYYQRLHPEATLTGSVSALGPEYLIVDDSLRAFVLSDEVREASSPYVRHLSLAQVDFDEFLSEDAHVVASVTSATYGEVVVFRLDPSMARVCQSPYRVSTISSHVPRY